MSSTFTEINNYFEQIAQNHRMIAHSGLHKHFYRMELEEVLTMMKNINYPALILEGYRFDYTDQRSDNVLKNRSGAFILAGRVSDIGDYAAIHQLLDTLEAIGDQILARIRADKHNPLITAVRDFDLNSVTAVLILNEHDKVYGIRYNYTLVSARPMVVDPAQWTE